MRVVVTAWVLVVVPLLVTSLVVAIVALPRMLASTGDAIAIQAHALARAWRHADVTQVLLPALAILALVIPVGGLLLMLIRAGRSYSTRIWRATTGNPRRRGAAVMAMAGITAGLVAAWWPHGNYRPIQRWERGTVQDALPASVTGGLVPGAERATETVWADDGQPLPTLTHPQLAVMLTPRSGHGPTWVFPFNRPAPQSPGGNQALAVVTRNGGTVYDAAFALVWVRDGVSVNRNEAYAFARCRHCRAVAVGFQVVLVVGPSRLAAPQNIAAAVSYGCVDCVTEALARQLVITLPRGLTPAQLRALHRIWREAVAFSHHLRAFTFAQLEAHLRSFEHRIEALVGPATYATPMTPAPTPSLATAAASTAPTPTTAVTASTSPAGSAMPSATSTTTASASPSSSTTSGSASPSTTTSSTASASPTSTSGSASPSP